jgi:hypothetical protein
MATRTVTRRAVGERPVPVGPAEFPYSQEDVLRRSRELGESAALLAKRQAAWETYQATPMPGTKDEAWRRTDLDGLPSASAELHAIDSSPVDAALLQPLVSDSQPALMVLHPGLPPRLEGAERIRSQGVVFADWQTAAHSHSQLLESHLGRLVDPAEGKFAALAAAMATDGVLVVIPAGISVVDPLHSVLWRRRAGARQD